MFALTGCQAPPSRVCECIAVLFYSGFPPPCRFSAPLAHQTGRDASSRTIFVSPLIYILAFGLGLGSSVGPGAGMSGAYGSYLEFMLPGMVALSSMTICFGGTTFSLCGERLFTKTFEEMLLLPVHPLALYLGKMLAGIVRGLMTSGSAILVAIAFTGKLWSFLNRLFLLVLALKKRGVFWVGGDCGVEGGLAKKRGPAE